MKFFKDVFTKTHGRMLVTNSAIRTTTRRVKANVDAKAEIMKRKVGV